MQGKASVVLTTVRPSAVITLSQRGSRSPLYRRGEATDQSFLVLAASLANRSAFNRSRFLRRAICSFSYSVSGLSDGRNMLLALFSRLLMTRPFELPGAGGAIANGIAITDELRERAPTGAGGLGPPGQ